MTETRENPEKSISEADFDRLWQSLTYNQRRFAVAMLDASSRRSAALAIGLKPNTVYSWSGDVIDEVVSIMQSRAKDTALKILVGRVVKASMIKAAGLDSDDEKIRQDTASEVLNRVLGTPTQRQVIEVPGGLGLVHSVSMEPGELEAIRNALIGEADSGTRIENEEKKP